MPTGVYKRTKPAWNKGLTKETDPRVAANAAHTKETVLKKYGSSSYFGSKEFQDLTSDSRHSGQLALKAAETKELRYGDPHYNNMEKNRQTKLDRYGSETYNNLDKLLETNLAKYGVEHPNQNSEIAKKISDTRIKEKSHLKALQTIIAKYGDMEKYYSEVAMKRYETMRKNGTLGNIETLPEKELYLKLCSEYGAENVIKQYYDKDRYPFKCDFYIVSEDKFIELHGFWTHGPHPFDKNNPEDIKILVDLEDQLTEWSKMIIYTWTNLDVRKLETAKKNNLNYEAIYWYNKN